MSFRAPPGRPRMDTTQSADGTTIAFDRYGDGPPLVLVSGATAHRAISPNVPTLAGLLDGFTVVAYDRRGRGDSGDTLPFAVEREIDDLAAVIAAAGGEAAVFGHSSGAVLALDAAATGLPISRLALYEPPLLVDDTRPPAPRDYLARLDAAVAQGRPEDCLTILMSDAIRLPADQVAGMRHWPMWPQLASVAHTVGYDARVMEGLMYGEPLPVDRWAKVAMPTLVMAGGVSESFMRSGAQALVDLLPDARIQILDGQGHGPADDVLGAALVAFLRS